MAFGILPRLRIRLGERMSMLSNLQAPSLTAGAGILNQAFFA
jgi:hypothetical protein